MTDDEWDDWAGYHATLHRMTELADLSMLALWRDVFEASYYTAGELRDASLHLAKTGAKWRTEHLEAIIARVTDRRLMRMQLELADADAKHAAEECKLCGGSGLIDVPDPRDMSGGEWRGKYRCCVTCRCYRGQRWVQSNQRTITAAEEKARGRSGEIPRRLVGIAEYELHHPGWESQMQLRQIRLDAERKARMATAHEDRRRGPLAGLMEHLTGQGA